MTKKTQSPRPSYREKLARFADLYLASPDPGVRGNATACYMTIHTRCKNESSAAPKASVYLNHPLVQERIQAHLDESGKKTGITVERTLEEIARIGLFDPRKLFDGQGNPLPISDLGDDVAAAIAGIKVREIPMGDDGKLATITEYRIADKNSALEKLMKYLGAYEKDNSQRAKSLSDLLQDIRNNE